ncbi:DUF2304 domain-containing protein [Cellulomonas cellasea]|uniref:DUF2304 domain-containing protein n=1 Tax=Cellulomonas cellasea TaxID=43670 RepID=A0A4Y3L496_9CELL|nr:DUF2304 domain-containing protein [Cellulomonas cellasea]GEA89950.1 hypothetical protein CCE01nite_38990 [Cellulomonas cellasea]
MWIKVILLVSISVIALIGLRAPRGARHLALRRITLLAFVLFAAASVLFPEVWNALANAVGVGRGTDLLLYGLILAFLGYMATSYLRFRGLEAQITLLARRIALDEVGVGPVPEQGAVGQEPTVEVERHPATP